MSRTPINNRALTEGKEKTPLTSRVGTAKDRTPLSGKSIREKTPQGNKLTKERGTVDARIEEASLDQRLLEVLRSLNLAVAAVAQARDQRFVDPTAKLSGEVAVQALLHLKDAAQHLDQLRSMLSGR